MKYLLLLTALIVSIVCYSQKPLKIKMKPRFLDTFGLQLAKDLGFPNYPGQRVILSDSNSNVHLFMGSAGSLVKIRNLTVTDTIPDGVFWDTTIMNNPDNYLHAPIKNSEFLIQPLIYIKDSLYYDTSRCIFLYADTFNIAPKSQPPTYISGCLWKFGYYIRQLNSMGGATWVEGNSISFLDEKRNPLPKSFYIFNWSPL